MTNREAVEYGKKWDEAIESRGDTPFSEARQFLSLAIKAFERSEWIPCSERLPEDMQKVLVWFEYYRYGDYNCMYQTYGFGYVCDGKWSPFINGETGWQDARIIAWMPLPEPYEKEEAESMSNLEKAKKIIKENFIEGNCGLFNTRNTAGDQMTTIYEEGGLRIDICYYWSYFEVFGLSNSEFYELLAYYNHSLKGGRK